MRTEKRRFRGKGRKKRGTNEKFNSTIGISNTEVVTFDPRNNDHHTQRVHVVEFYLFPFSTSTF